MRKGEIYYADVPMKHVVGHEQGNSNEDRKRPWLIVSADVANRGGTVVVVPLTTNRAQLRGPVGCRVEVSQHDIDSTDRDVGTTDNSVALCDQIRVMSTDRMQKPTQRLGKLKSEKMAEIEGALQIVLGLPAT